MKRRSLLPAPLLSAALFVLWLLLNESLEATHLLLGAIVAVAAPWLSAPLRPVPARVRRPGVALALAAEVIRDVALSNAQVAWRIVNMQSRPPRSAFVTVPIEMRDPNGLAVLALITTVVPGTIWSELAVDSSELLVHVFDLEDESAFITHFKDRYERPLREIFE